MQLLTKVFSARPGNFDMVHLFISYSHVIIKQVFARTEKMSGLIHYLDGHKIKVDHGFFPPTITNYASFLQSFEFTFSKFSLIDRENFAKLYPNIIYDTLSRDHEQIPFVIVFIKSQKLNIFFAKFLNLSIEISTF